MTGASSQRLVRSICAFGIVGVVATLTHAAVGLGLVNSGTMEPFNANIIAFSAAFLVSYFGHRRHTFQSSVRHSRALPRFFAAAVLGLVLNQVIVFVCVGKLNLGYGTALVVVVTLVPAVVFVLGRFWAFREVSA